MINEAWIKTKSQELDIPFSHILSAYVLETTVRIFAELADAKDFWLEGSDRLGLDVYKRSVSEKVRYYYTGGKAFKEIKERIRQDLLQAYEKEGFGVELVSEEKEGQGFRMNFSMEVCGMYVPFRVSLLPFGGEHIFPKEENLRLFLENNKTIGIYAYPVEQIAAEHLLPIVKQLELLQDMEHYQKLYEILSKYPLEGRKVQESLGDLCRKDHVKCSALVWDSLSGYGTYSYMEKKWKSLLRKEKKKEPVWQEVHGLICRFLEPIWEKLMEDQIFFGDWMPQLGRFLD